MLKTVFIEFQYLQNKWTLIATCTQIKFMQKMFEFLKSG